MDVFFVIEDSATVVDKFTSEDAAISFINRLASSDYNAGRTYSVAQVIATNRTNRVWNRP
jgi:hypothetical protein